MAIRRIIEIDSEKCNGCEQCVDACHEGAIQMVDGKAKLVKDIYCDGLGDCIGECPVDAIKIIEREADDFDEVAVEKRMQEMKKGKEPVKFSGCPGTAARTLKQNAAPANNTPAKKGRSELGHWPVQIKLIPPSAPYLKNADILICADCVPFAYPDLHAHYLRGRIVMVGCPKLDDVSFYREKFEDIFRTAKPRSITVLKMEVPCCSGIGIVSEEAAAVACPDTPVEVITIGINGEIK